jgi:hypothetical protein
MNFLYLFLHLIYTNYLETYILFFAIFSSALLCLAMLRSQNSIWDQLGYVGADSPAWNTRSSMAT